MHTLTSRRLLAVALLSTTLAGCGAFQTASPARPAPTSAVAPIPAATAAALPTSVPTASALPTSVPAAVPAPTLAPTAAQGESKLPAPSDPAWIELGRGDFSGDGAEERALYLPSQVMPRQGFADPYLGGKAMMASVLLIAQADDTIALQLDRTSVRTGGAELRPFAAEAAPSAFEIALDLGNPYLLTVMPLGANGLQLGEIFVVAVEQGAYTIVELPQANLTTRPDDSLAAVELAPEPQQEIAIWALQYLSTVAPGRPAVVGALAQAGDYAVAHATVFGAERPRTLYLRHDADGWNVVLDTTQVGASLLEQAGVPLALADASPRADVLDAAAAHLQDPRGRGSDGSLVLEAFDGSFARLVFLPTQRDLYEAPTMFFAGTQSGWHFVTAGTAFRPEDYDALGIPTSVR